MPILIAKQFGGTSATNKERIFNAARRCIANYEKGHDVVVVLSARGKYTDELIASAKEIHLNPFLSLLHSNNLPTLLHKNTLCVFRYSHFVFIYWIYRIYTAFSFDLPAIFFENIRNIP